ncbi:recombinase family protein [Phenylobacterium sp. J367]|uniref:recombinase family protein n=1 Tax=Phenylobacterium sp. J367 TaxID=2898435 RepID=UPI002150FA70|nr:recombinase family protein [Phenylobacterium sp. J367]MCR5879060.1 recombinase family protein [Phenylobacterium sp. J367]
MLRIGYVRLRDEASASDSAALKAMGCHVVRAEEPARPGSDEYAVLDSILEFIGAGDQLVITQLGHLGRGGRNILEVVERLEQRGASLYITEAGLSTEGSGGLALKAALTAVATLDPPGLLRRRRPAATQEIRDLQRAGVGPVEIARRLGVSRMTVWRKLRAAEPQPAEA